MSLMRILKTIFFLSLLAGTSVVGFNYWETHIKPYESTENTYLKAHMSLISPRESGYVKSVHFENNQSVKAGDLLVTIDDAAEADLDRANKDLNRFSRLVREGAVSTQTYDTAQAAVKQARAQLDKVTSDHEEAERQLTGFDARINEAQARIKSVEASLEMARIALSHTRIYAPINGTIGNRSVQVGQLVKPGVVLAYLIPAKGLYVEANFKETQIEHMRPGQPVDITVDAYPDQPFRGKVDSFAPASGSEFSLLPPENATGNFTKIVRRVPVKITFDPGTDLTQLRPGLSANAKVRVQ
jgi:membrane fusion protein (multidrug efflux system)